MGCTSLPPPRDVYRDTRTVVQLRSTKPSDPPYSHPGSVSPAQMAQVLSGVHLRKRSDPIVSLLTGEAEAVPAFSPGDIQVLAPLLSQALQHASPHEIATFYRRQPAPKGGLTVTSGGMYLRRENELVVIVANSRNRPADVLGHRQAMLYEIDPVNDPLLSLGPSSFVVSFRPSSAVRSDPPEKRQYVEPSKVVVVDLTRLPAPAAPAEP